MLDNRQPENTGGQPTKNFVRGTVKLEPHATKRLPLGSYASSDYQPEFDLITTPHLDERLAASLERLDIPGEPRYILFYSLHNFSEKPCEVTVTRREGQ